MAMQSSFLKIHGNPENHHTITLILISICFLLYVKKNSTKYRIQTLIPNIEFNKVDLKKYKTKS